MVKYFGNLQIEIEEAARLEALRQQKEAEADEARRIQSEEKIVPLRKLFVKYSAMIRPILAEYYELVGRADMPTEGRFEVNIYPNGCMSKPYTKVIEEVVSCSYLFGLINSTRKVYRELEFYRVGSWGDTDYMEISLYTSSEGDWFGLVGSLHSDDSNNEYFEFRKTTTDANVGSLVSLIDDFAREFYSKK